MKTIFNKFAVVALVFFYACGSTQSEVKKDTLVKQDSSKTTSTKIIPRTIMSNGFYAYYVLNNQYAGSPESKMVEKWVHPFLDTLLIGGFENARSLFSPGAGPMGAQWNPNADMLIVAVFKGELDTSTVAFSSNDFPINAQFRMVEKKSIDDITICWFVIQNVAINGMRHMASAKEVNEICKMKKMETSSWIKNSCSVVKISVKAKQGNQEVIMRDYLLLSYGE